MRQLSACCVMAATLGMATAQLAGADTIDEMVHNSGALGAPSGDTSTNTVTATSTLRERTATA
jgi:hypothetical protein